MIPLSLLIGEQYSQTILYCMCTVGVLVLRFHQCLLPLLTECWTKLLFYLSSFLYECMEALTVQNWRGLHWYKRGREIPAYTTDAAKLNVPCTGRLFISPWGKFPTIPEFFLADPSAGLFTPWRNFSGHFPISHFSKLTALAVTLPVYSNMWIFHSNTRPQST